MECETIEGEVREQLGDRWALHFNFKIGIRLGATQILTVVDANLKLLMIDHQSVQRTDVVLHRRLVPLSFLWVILSC